MRSVESRAAVPQVSPQEPVDPPELRNANVMSDADVARAGITATDCHQSQKHRAKDLSKCPGMM